MSFPRTSAFLISCVALLTQLLVNTLSAQQWYPNANYSGVEPVDGYWDDSANWVNGNLPQDGYDALILGLTWPTNKNIVITYRNSYDPTAVFNSIQLGTVPPTLTVDFLLGVDLDTLFLLTDESISIEHSGGRLRTDRISLSGDYELSGNASIERYTQIPGFPTARVGPDGTFLHTSGSFIGTVMDLDGDYQLQTGTAGFTRLHIGGSFTQSDGDTDVRMVNLFEANSSLSISGGTFDLLEVEGLNGGIAVGGRYDDGYTPPSVSEKATLYLGGDAVLTTAYTTDIGKEFSGEVLQEGTSQFLSSWRVRVGDQAPGLYTLNGGTLTCDVLTIGINATGEFIQNGGTVNVEQNTLGNEGFFVGSDTHGGTYRLNLGTLNFVDGYIKDTFIHTAGSLNSSGSVALTGQYTLSSGSFSADTLLAVSGTFDFDGGSLTDGDFTLLSDGDFTQAANLHHQTNGNARFENGTWNYSLGANASHTINGDATFYNSTWSTSDLLGANAIFQVAGKLVLQEGSTFTHDVMSLSLGGVEISGGSALQQTGGDLGILGLVEVIAGSQWNLVDGQVLHTGQLVLGLHANAGNSSTFHQTGGNWSGQSFDLNQKTTFRAAGGMTSFVGDGIVNGTLLVQTGGDFSVDDLSVFRTGVDPAVLTQNGGDLDGAIFTGGAQSISTFSAGNASFDSLQLLDTATFKVSGGSVGISGDASLVDGSSLEISYGSLTVGGTTTLEGNNTLILSGGTFSTQAIARAPGVSFPSWTAGTLHIAGTSAIGATGALGTSLSLTNNGPLAIGQAFTVQDTGQLQIGVGGDLNVDTLLVEAGGVFTMSDGSFETTGDLTTAQNTFNQIIFSSGALTIGGDWHYAFNGAPEGSAGYLRIEGDANLDVAGNFHGESNATVVQDGTSDLTIAGDFLLGTESGEDAYYILSSGTSLSSATAQIGGAGRGRLVIFGSHTVTGQLSVGSTTASSSHYKAYSGTAQLGSVLVASQEGSRGLFDVGASTTVTGAMTVADAVGAEGTLKVGSGFTSIGSLKVGGAGTGVVDQQWGNFDIGGQFHLANGGSYLLKAGLADAASFLNDGTLEIVTNADYPRFGAPITNQGAIKVYSDWQSDESSLVHSNTGTVALYDDARWDFSNSNQFTNLQGGIIEGQGRMGGTSFSFINQGLLRPGHSPGRLTLQGNMTSGSTAELEFEFTGPLSSNRDQLLVTGRCALDGKLTLIFDGYFPSLNDRFVLIDTSIALTGDFNEFEVIGLPSNIEAVPHIVGNDLVLDILAPLTPPSGLSVVNATSTTLPISWIDSNGGSAGYRLRFATAPAGPWTTLPDLAVGTTSTTLSSLSPGTAYWIEVRAVTTTQESQWTTALLASTVVAELANWRLTHFGTESNTGLAADDATPNNDGIANLIKYALGMTPLLDTLGHPHLPSLTTVNVPEEIGSFPSIRFTVPEPLPAGITLHVETSIDLGTWNADAVLHENDTTTEPNKSRQTWRAPAVLGPDEPRFFLIRVERN